MIDNRLLNWFLAGFPSPWRWLRRKYWRSRYEKMGPEGKWIAYVMSTDPDSLIERGYL